jgi:hypothetical protein
MELTASLPVIGVVRTSHHERETTPIQAGLNRAEHATIEIAEPSRQVTRFDRPPGNPRCGWFDEIAIADGITPEQLARS